MRDKEKLSEQLERYAAGAMEPGERAAFEQLMGNDRALADEAAMHRTIQRVVGDADRRRLLEVLDELPAEPRATVKVSFSRFWPAAAAACFLLALGAWWWFSIPVPPQETVQNTDFQANQDTPQVKPPADALNSGLEKPAPKQITMADPSDFSPNPALDPLVGTQIRSISASLSLVTPRQDMRYTVKNGRVTLEIKGGGGSEKRLNARIFDNKAVDFSKQNALKVFELPMRNDSFIFKTSIVIKPGRYYLLLCREDSDEPELVSRFFVR